GLEATPGNPAILAYRVLLEYETGESVQGEVYLERLLEAMRRTGPEQLLAAGLTCQAIPAVARITGVPGRLEIAEAAAQAVLSGQAATPIFVLQAKAGLALLAVQKGDQSAAAEHYAYFLGHRSTMIWTGSSADRLLGLLSQTMGNMDQAAAHFENAQAFCRKAGYRPELAWTCCDYADALRQRDDYGDRAIAIALLDEALAISTELGMWPLMDRVKERLERVRAEPARAPTYPDGLTQREVEVLRLIAAGKTNVEIAEELVIAEGTARRHVANIYEKIGAANRVEAASYAAQHGLSR
ncbi:MAG: response regulator transcription factor, partial [Chloroflexi bacterium]|nr:response regulator transcription factor [Chloroflexota bacterium]